VIDLSRMEKGADSLTFPASRALADIDFDHFVFD